ncbi:hypothetical protein WEIDD23_00157 [Weissella sp. DD23]|nr:hypothetical protein WEIDD23_00157 [Weissella sp. DD23]
MMYGVKIYRQSSRRHPDYENPDAKPVVLTQPLFEIYKLQTADYDGRI